MKSIQVDWFRLDALSTYNVTHFDNIMLSTTEFVDNSRILVQDFPSEVCTEGVNCLNYLLFEFSWKDTLVQ